MSDGLTHLDSAGNARMVDVGDKPATERRAVARAVVRVTPETAALVQQGNAPKGDVLGVARIAGIQAAKRTSELIPLCHPLALSFVGVEGSIDVEAGEIELIAEARTTGPTGVEMEALTAASVAALTVYDMVKGVAARRRDRLGGAAARSPAGARGEWQTIVVKTAILTVSTSVAAGETEDRSGDALAEQARARGCRDRRSGRARRRPTGRSRTGCAARRPAGASLIFTTGGTGLTDDDVTPEATRAVIDRDAPGFAEAMRAEALRYTPMGILTRGVSGIVGRTLIINFPGNPKAIGELFPVIAPTLGHVVATLQRERGERTPGH